MSRLNTPVSDNDFSIGTANARCTLVEYGDYQCSYCGQAYPIVKQLRKRFSADLRFVFRNFPLGEMHPQAQHAAEAAMFAGKHKKFWEMHDLLFENQESLGDDDLLLYADLLKLKADQLSEALSSGRYQYAVKADFMGGVRSGVNGTPTFFVNGQRHDGGFDMESLFMAIQSRM
jgi:protein-disulfide isomerase